MGLRAEVMAVEELGLMIRMRMGLAILTRMGGVGKIGKGVEFRGCDGGGWILVCGQ